MVRNERHNPMFSLLLICFYFVYGQCQAHQEIRDLSPQQLTSFVKAMGGLRDNGVLSQFTTKYATESATGAEFFSWNRAFLKDFENNLQTVDSTVTLPFWDWTRDYAAPENSPVLQDGLMGGDGASSGMCVTNGCFAGWNATVPASHCLQRHFNLDGKTGAFYSAPVLEAILRSAVSDENLYSMLAVPAGVVYVGIGGDMNSVFAPNDPLLYLHHAFIDSLWYEWQMRKSVQSDSSYPRFSGNLPKITLLDQLLPKDKSLDSLVVQYEQQAGTLARGLMSSRITQASQSIPSPLSTEYINQQQFDLQAIRKLESTLGRLIKSISLLA